METIAVTPNDVVITPTVAKFGNTSYPIAAINSVNIQIKETQIVRPLVGWAALLLTIGGCIIPPTFQGRRFQKGF
jgi:hypothetical protein